jgi:hypothetical protein
MSPLKWEMNLGTWERIVAVGGVLSLMSGVIMRATGWTGEKGQQLDLIADLVGIVLFLVTIYLYMTRLRQTVEYMQEKLGSNEHKLSELKYGYEREPLFGTVTPIIARLKNPENHIFSASAGMLEYIAKNYLQDTARQLDAACDDVQIASFIDGLSPIYFFMDKIAEILPSRSVWIGVSLLSSLDAWEGDDLYTQWTRRLRDRCKLNSEQRIHICRVCCFLERERLKSIETEITAQVRDKVLARVLTGQDYKSVERDVADLSLIWVPSRGANILLSEDLARDPIDTLRNSGYIPLPSLYFKIWGSSNYIERVTVESERGSVRRTESFRKIWAQSKEFAIPSQGTPAA